MARRRQLVLTRVAEGAEGEMRPLGGREEVIAAMGRFNTAADGSNRATGVDVLWGPGMVVEIPSGLEVVNQAMVTVTDDDIAWAVLQRMCKSQGWKMVDLESGRIFG